MTKPIEDILMEDEDFTAHFVQRHNPKYQTVPETNYRLFREEDTVRPVIDGLRRFLTEYPLIEDNFGEGARAHSLRDVWIGGLAGKYPQREREVWNYLKQENKLARSIVAHAVRAKLDILLMFLEDKSQSINEAYQQVIGIFDASRDGYCNMPIAQKIQFVRNVEDGVYGFFKAIAVRESPPK